MSSPDEPRDFVMHDRQCYPAEAFHAALAEATANRLEALLPQGATPRQAFKAVRSLKTPEAHAAVMSEAMRILRDSGTAVPLVEAIKLGNGLPIAAFPGSLKGD